MASSLFHNKIGPARNSNCDPVIFYMEELPVWTHGRFPQLEQVIEVISNQSPQKSWPQLLSGL